MDNTQNQKTKRSTFAVSNPQNALKVSWFYQCALNEIWWVITIKGDKGDLNSN